MTKTKKKRSKKMTTAIVEKSIALQTVVDLVAAHLYATSIIDDNINIDDIVFGDEKDGLVPLKILTSKEVSVVLNG